MDTNVSQPTTQASVFESIARMLTTNLTAALHQHLLDSPCSVSALDARVKVATNYFYPDIVVDCDEDIDGDSLYAQQPTLIIEILSKTTRQRDKGPKLLNYINTDSLLEYVLVEPDFISIEVFRRSEGWILRHYGPGDSIHFESIDLTMAVETIYHRVVSDESAS